jgi:hypothetical protein
MAEPICASCQQPITTGDYVTVQAENVDTGAPTTFTFHPDCPVMVKDPGEN